MPAAALAPHAFASRLHSAIAQAKTGNIFLSPFSVQAALGMCASGARGETRRALSELLGVPEDTAEQTRYFEALLRTINGDGSARDYELVTANALWLHKDFEWNPHYLDRIHKCYGGALRQVDYVNAPDDAVKQINTWVDETTRHRIPKLIQRQDVNALTRLVLTNAIYFKGQWAYAFKKEDTKKETWDQESRTHYPTWMMNGKGAYSYYQGRSFEALELPYKGDDLAMLILLPNSGHTPDQIDLTPALYQEIIDGLDLEEKVLVKLPRFKVESSFNLGARLQEMGAGIAFSGAADFTGISPLGGLGISEVIHKAFVEVNEEGTEAAAATAVVMGLACVRPEPQPKQFYCTRPFLFLIHNVKTNAVLFSGRLVEPERA